MPTGYARASNDDQSLAPRCEHHAGSAEAARAVDMSMVRPGRPQRDLILFGRAPDGEGIGLMGVQEIIGLGGGRLVFHLRT